MPGPAPSFRRAGWRDLRAALATAWAAEQRSLRSGRRGAFNHRAGWRTVIALSTCGGILAGWLWTTHPAQAVVMVIPATQPIERCHALRLGIAAGAAAGLAALAGTQRPGAALATGIMSTPFLIALALLATAVLDRIAARTRREHGAARQEIDRRAPGNVVLIGSAASRGNRTGQPLWAALLARADQRGDTLLLQTSGDSRIAYYERGTRWEVVHRVADPGGDRVLMVRWPRSAGDYHLSCS